MQDILLGFSQINTLWYAAPLVVVVSLVYAATRHEEAVPILIHSLRIGAWIVSFMATVFAVLLAIAWWI